MPKRRSAPCFPIQAFPVVVGNFPAQPIAGQPAFDDHVIGATFPLGRQRETETALIVLDPRDRPRAAELADVAANERAVTGLADLQPGWVIAARAMHHKVPSADQRRRFLFDERICFVCGG